MNCDLCGKEINCGFSIKDGECFCTECDDKKTKEELGKIKYYSFEDFEYNAIIMATSEEMALEGYYVEISEAVESSKTKEISEKDAVILYLKYASGDLAFLLGEFFEIKQELIKNINKGYLQYEVLLLDSSLY